MKVVYLRTNHISNPLGFELSNPRFSWITEDTKSKFQAKAQVEIALDEAFENIIFDSGKKEDIDSLSYVPDIRVSPRTRYFWRVTVWGDAGDSATSEAAWFETAKIDEGWQAKWITPDMNKEIHPLIRKSFDISMEINCARAYLCGLGLYELEINGRRVSDEYFAPGINSYDFWLQYQTYDITDLLCNGENSIGIMLGNGVYKGRFGFDGGYYELYGDKFAAVCEIVITLKDGTEVVIGSDESWKCAPSPIKFSGIYDGEIYDAISEVNGWSSASFDDSSWEYVNIVDLGFDKLKARLSLPVKIKEELKPIEVIHTPAGEIVLDMGQNMTGWVKFIAKAPKGTELMMKFGEILQKDCFYQENLRTAKAEFRYISDGRIREVQPHFTYYGFRYVKLTGFDGEIKLEDFTGCVIYSDIEEKGSLETSNPLVNRLFLNAQWGQKGNFLDVPTDCPQRDERMGWTGDAQIFASTACFNMYSPAFYNKYLFDLREEQKRLGGSVPFVVPMIKPKDNNGFIMGHGSAAWGDAAAVIPWTLYLHYGDKELLSRQLETMKDWVDYIKKIDDNTGAKRLWKVGFHFADWLALDGKEPGGVMGGTDIYYIASAYYCHSTELVAKAAKALGKTDMENEYSKLADEIREAIKNEYFTPNGRSAIDTQTAMIVALYMNLVPEDYRPRLIEDLKTKLREDNMHLKTGFVGTPYFCRVLSDNGANEYAYKLLLNDDYPSWLYAVKLGATTIWERWNSVLPDGSISGTGMNSLNHYAYGSIAEWMYRNMCGINPVEDAPGFRKIKFAPKPHGSIGYAKASLNSASGYLESSWRINDDGSLTFKFTVPFNSTAQVVLPDAKIAKVMLNERPVLENEVSARQRGKCVVCDLTSGTYVFKYIPSIDYILKYSCDNKLKELMENCETKAILEEIVPELVNNQMVLARGIESTLTDMVANPFTAKLITSGKVEKLNVRLAKIRIKTE
jgi:alpha-L-rhamnosidase